MLDYREYLAFREGVIEKGFGSGRTSLIHLIAAHKRNKRLTSAVFDSLPYVQSTKTLILAFYFPSGFTFVLNLHCDRRTKRDFELTSWRKAGKFLASLAACSSTATAFAVFCISVELSRS